MKKYSFKKTSLNELFQPLTHLANDRRFESFSSEEVEEREFVPVTGYHVYSDIRLKLSITAGEEDRDSARYLKIMQDCATAADECAGIAGVRLLEVQNDKLHFVIEAPIADTESMGRMLAFCAAFTKRIFDQVVPRDPTAWVGFAMAVDHGPAVIVNPHWDTSDSFVSLGVAANTPAKRLYQEPTVPSGHVAINQNMPRSNNNDLKPEWKSLLLYSKSQSADFQFDEAMDRKMYTALANRFSATSPEQLIELSAANEFLRKHAGKADSPTRVQGFYKRADIDGFTAAVKAAFAKKTDEALENLLREFYDAMSMPEHFKALMSKRQIDVFQLPVGWRLRKHDPLPTFLANLSSLPPPNTFFRAIGLAGDGGLFNS